MIITESCSVTSKDFDWEGTIDGLQNLFCNSLAVPEKMMNLDTNSMKTRCRVMTAEKLISIATAMSSQGTSPLPLSQLLEQAQKLCPEVEIPGRLKFAITGWANAAGQGKTPQQLDALWHELLESTRTEVANIRSSRGPRNRGGKKKKKKGHGKRKQGKEDEEEEEDTAVFRNDECPFCIEDIGTTGGVSKIRCSGQHGYCSGCLAEWRRQCGNTGLPFICPVCRGELA